MTDEQDLKHKELDGRKIAAELRAETADEVAALKEAGWAPRLISVVIGDTAAVEIYVRNQRRTAEKVGIEFEERDFPADITEPEMYSHFVNGLKNYLKDKIVPFVGQTTAEAIAAAERIDSVQIRSYEGNRNRRWTKKRTDKSSGPPKVSNVKTSDSGSKKPTKKKDGGRGPVKCWNCGKEGHLKRDCKEKKKGN